MYSPGLFVSNYVPQHNCYYVYLSGEVFMDNEL